MRHIFVVLALVFSTPAFAAYYGVLDNGEILDPGKFKLTGDVQALTKNGGMNLGVTADLGLHEDYGLRALLGTGKTDFYAGGMFKWMPIPDIENQPAMGVNIGIIYGKDTHMTDLTFRAEPMLSKKIVLESATFTPYAALPVNVRVRNTDDPDIKEQTTMASNWSSVLNCKSKPSKTCSSSPKSAWI